MTENEQDHAPANDAETEPVIRMGPGTDVEDQAALHDAVRRRTTPDGPPTQQQDHEHHAQPSLFDDDPHPHPTTP